MQTSQNISKGNNQSLMVDNPHQKNKKEKTEKNKETKLKEKPYWELLIPRSGTKDRLEIW